MAPLELHVDAAPCFIDGVSTAHQPVVARDQGDNEQRDGTEKNTESHESSSSCRLEAERRNRRPPARRGAAGVRMPGRTISVCPERVFGGEGSKDHAMAPRLRGVRSAGARRVSFSPNARNAAARRTARTAAVLFVRKMSAVLGLGEARRTLRWVAADSESGAYDCPSCGQIATECTILGHYEPARSRKAASPEGQDSRRQRRGGSASGVLRPVPVYDAPYEGETPPLPRAWCLGDSPPGRNARRPQPDWHASW